MVAVVKVPGSVEVTEDAQICLFVHLSWIAGVARELCRRVGCRLGRGGALF